MNYLRILLPLILFCSYAFGQSATEYFNQGVAKYNNENYRGALKDLDLAIELNPRNAEAFFVRGNIKFSKFNQNLIGAKEDYTKAIEIDSDFAKAYYNRGLVNTNLEKYQLAIQDFTKAIEIDPNYVQAYQTRAQAKKLNGDKEGAALDLEAALDIGSGNPILSKKVQPMRDTLITKADSVKSNTVETVLNTKSVYVDLEAFAPVEKEINFAGNQLLNARRTFVVGLLLNLAGGVLLASTGLTSDPKKQLGLGIAGAITTTVGGIVMLTAVIPIGGAGKILQKVRFPKRIRVDIEQ